MTKKFYEKIGLEDRAVFSMNVNMMEYHTDDRKSFIRDNKYKTYSKRHSVLVFHCFPYYKNISRCINMKLK